MLLFWGMDVITGRLSTVINVVFRWLCRSVVLNRWDPPPCNEAALGGPACKRLRTPGVDFTLLDIMWGPPSYGRVTTLPVLSPCSDISRVVSRTGTTWAVSVWVLVTLSWSSVAVCSPPRDTLFSFCLASGFLCSFLQHYTHISRLMHSPTSLIPLTTYGMISLGNFFSRGVTRSGATRSCEIKPDNISCHVKNLSHQIWELSELLFVTCGGSNAPLLRLACQNLKKEKEKKKRRRRRGSSKQPEWCWKILYYHWRCP